MIFPSVAPILAGSTWVQEMAWLVKHDANIKESYKEPKAVRLPLLEWQGTNKERLMKSHLPAHFLEKQVVTGNSKVIIVKRDLKDNLVSFFNHYKNGMMTKYKGTWDMFFELFKKRQLYYGDWGEFYAGWQKYRDNPNFLFLQYESMKLDPHRVVRMIAEHCDKPLTEEQVNTVVHHTRFEEMKTNPMMSITYNPNFFRKGIVGDWRNYFSTDQHSIVEKYEKELKL